MRLLPCGPRAVLVEFDDVDAVMDASTRWRDEAIDGVIDIVPAARTVLVEHDGTLDVTRLVVPRGDDRRRPATVDGPVEIGRAHV